MAESTTYAGLTIGPIGEVMRHSKKTREQWFGSYFFSWFMEIVMTNLAKLYGKHIFLTPRLMDQPNISYGGKYPDRFVLQTRQSVEDVYAAIDQICDETRQFFSKMIAELPKGKPFAHVDLDHILKHFLQIRFFCMDETDFFNSVQGEQKLPVAIADMILDSLESTFFFEPGQSEQTCNMCKMLPACVSIAEKKIEMDLCPICYLKRFAHESETLTNRVYFKSAYRVFPSIQEISIRELDTKENKDIINSAKDKENDNEIDLNQLNQLLKKQTAEKESLKQYHKYIAIVQADGDNLGTLAKEPDINPQELSNRLFNFAADVEALIDNYGGYPIFLGGDDILAYLPVCYNNTTILDFVYETYDTYMKKVDIGKQKTSISFGVNIVYYKYPLARALEEAGNLLFNVAKNEKGKASLAVSLTKHSGAANDFVLNFTNPAQTESFYQLQRAIRADKTILPRGISHNLRRFQSIVNKLQQSEPQNQSANRLDAFFSNTLNEPIFTQYNIKTLKQFVHTFIFSHNHKDFDSVLNILKYLKFLTDEADHG